MSEYRELVKNFFTRYEKPVLDPLVIGFSGIDPPLKVNAGEIDHEELQNLLGGDDTDGHYHLTLEEWLQLRKLLDWQEYDGGTSATLYDEYEGMKEYWLDGGFSLPQQENEIDGGRANT